MKSVKRRTAGNSFTQKGSDYLTGKPQKIRGSKVPAEALRGSTLANTQEFFLLKETSGYTTQELSSLLGTTDKTIRNKKNNGETFDLSQTERIRKLSRLFTEGLELFGEKNEFNKWLKSPSYALDYSIPFELLKKPGGLDKVISELTALKYGETI